MGYERMLDKVNALQRQFAIQFALKEGLVTKETADSVLSAEVEIDAMSKTFLEGSKLSPVNTRFASNLIMNAKSLVSIKISRLVNEFEKLLLPLAIATGPAVNAFLPVVIV